jgi:hypothetical protein
VSVGDRICRDKRQIEVEDFVLSSVPADGILVQNQFTASQCWHGDVELGARLRARDRHSFEKAARQSSYAMLDQHEM